MPYEIALDRDMERGLDRYTVIVGTDLDVGQAHQLGDWLSAAALNPTATFTIDVTCAGWHVESVLLARSSQLRDRGRVEITRRGPAGRPARAAA
jgi:hypothetical protein